jgi:maltose-binding protein MalE
MKLKIFVTFASILLVSVFLVACGGKSSNEESSSQVMETEDIKALVHDYSVGNIKDQSASITSEQLLVTDSDKKQYVYDLPEDEFFVSIAPYIDSTHP